MSATRWRVRPLEAADVEQALLLDSISFGLSYSAEDAEFVLRGVRERMLVAEDATGPDPVVVGVTSHYDGTISLPGGALVQAPGITWVSVRPTHRRRGVLTAMMHSQLDAFRAAGAPVAVLTATESGIYGRYGFGAATRKRIVTVDRRRVRLADPGDHSEVQVVTAGQLCERGPALYEAQRAQVPGMVSRTQLWWDQFVEDPPIARGGLSQRQSLIHPEGYVSFRAEESSQAGNPANRAVITDYQPGTRVAHAALWSVLLGMDLFDRIDVRLMAADDPLPGLVGDPRSVRVSSDDDGMWVRPLHLTTLLAARTYGSDVDLVIGVRDQRYGDSAVHLVGSPQGAECTSSRNEPDVVLDVATLGAVSLGGVRLQWCAGVSGDPSAIRVLDRALLSDREPNHGTGF